MKNLSILLLVFGVSGFLFGCANQHSPSDGMSNAPSNTTGTSTSPAATPEANETLETPGSAKNGIESIYTDLTAAKCKTIESDESGAGYYRGKCAGVGGYQLELIEGDIRQTINVIAPNGKVSELEFWSKVSSAFSSVGEKAEWRVKKVGKDVKPFALIIRYNTSEDSEKPEKNTSRLVVTKISGDSTCITDVVEPIKDANVRARELADVSADKPCKN